jgi:hypothetical protein
MQRLTAEKNSGRSNVVSHVDEEQREVSAAPEQTGQHD